LSAAVRDSPDFDVQSLDPDAGHRRYQTGHSGADQDDLHELRPHVESARKRPPPCPVRAAFQGGGDDESSASRDQGMPLRR